jgi:hypothetical protein
LSKGLNPRARHSPGLTIARFFPDDKFERDADSNRVQSSGERLHMRGMAVKELIVSGKFSAEKLHAALSWHAWSQDGARARHAAEGPCEACEALCAQEYAALNPKKNAGGRPRKQGQPTLRHCTERTTRTRYVDSVFNVILVLVLSCHWVLIKRLTYFCVL